MSKGRAGGMLGVGGSRAHLSRKQLRGNGRSQGHGQGRANGPSDPAAQKRELLRKLQESRNAPGAAVND